MDSLDYEFLAAGNDIFDAAANYVRTHTSNFNKEDLLYLYGRYKQLQAKKKWRAWSELNGTPESECADQYIERVGHLHPAWDEEPEGNSGISTGVRVSTMANLLLSSQEGSFHARPGESRIDAGHDATTERVVAAASPAQASRSAEEARLFDHVKEGDLSSLETYFGTGDKPLEARDENGMNLLHWASDRGHITVVELLIGKGCDVNAVDLSGQTALHYAASCEYSDIVSYLLDHGANPCIPDNDHNLPIQLTDSPSITDMLNTHNALLE